MHTFLTPEPLTIEIRNSAGSVQVDLADVTTTHRGCGRPLPPTPSVSWTT